MCFSGFVKISALIALLMLMCVCVCVCVCVCFPGDTRRKIKKSSEGFKMVIIKSSFFVRIVFFLTQLCGPLRLCANRKRVAGFGNCRLKGTQRNFAYS